MKFLIYVLFKDPSWNSSTQIDICSVLYAFANPLKQAYDAATGMKKSAILNILSSLKILQDMRKEMPVERGWNCSVITDGLDVSPIPPAPAWKDANNQIVNDLLGLGLFAIGALGVE
jgi:hypothetical protein